MTKAPFHLDIDPDGVAHAIWDMPDRVMNIITFAVMDALDGLIDTVAADPAIKGCVISSGKDSFSGGADLNMLEAIAREFGATATAHGEEAATQAFFERSRRLSQIYRRVETCGKPFAAAIHGACLGGAFELALACHYRIMADDDATRVGLPEIKIGLFPGAGGTQRVARLMTTGDVLQMLFKGDQLRPAQAKAMNLVHDLAPAKAIVSRAKAWIAQGGEGVAPWDRPGFRPPSGQVYSRGGMMVWPAANAIYRRETMDNYPAAKAILQVVHDGLQLPMDLALRAESRWFAKILRSPEAAAMIRSLFVSMTALNKGAHRPAHIAPAPVGRIGVIGAGFMGAGIGYVCAAAGFGVTMIDRNLSLAERGKATARKLICERVLRGRASEAERDALLDRMTTTDDFAALSDCDLVIEAVFEDRDVKARTIREAERHMRPDAIFASNTSTLPITSLADSALRPEQFIGLHFFSPVEKMPLVEVVMGGRTGQLALAAALDLVRALRKTPIVVNDSRGFFANRCVMNFIREGHLMFTEGTPPAMIENAARMAGMPVGPLALNDEVGLDLAWKIIQATKLEIGGKAVDARQEWLLDRLVNEHQRLGRKSGGGFYDYPENGRKRLWSGLSLLQTRKLDPDAIDVKELQLRFLVVQAMEAARTMEEGVVTDPREADVGSILGFGFAPFTGGVLSYIDGMGAAAFVGLCERLAATHGPRFAPCALLVDMAAKRELFYTRFAPATTV